MRLEALKYIACPKCKFELKLSEKYEKQGEQIMLGGLLCQECNFEYQIIKGVPNLLPKDVKYGDVATGEAYSGFYDEMVTENTNSNDLLYGKTPLQEFEDFQNKTLFYNENLLKDKIFLDAGCGLARIEGILAKHCSMIVAFDITPSVYKAFETWKDKPNIHIVRGDLTSLPTRKECFDIVWCDGALPYVSNVELAITELLKARKANGYLYSWCYGPKIGSNEIIGRLFHYSRLPISIRFTFIRIVSWIFMAFWSLISRKRMFSNAKRYAESVLDYSLAGKVNHITKDRLIQLLDLNVDHVLYEVIAHPKSSIEFRVNTTLVKENK